MAETRLTQVRGPIPNPSKVAGHNFRRVGDRVLLTNEAGEFAWLEERDYDRYLRGVLSKDERLGGELREKGFLREHLDFAAQAGRMTARRLLDWKGPSVHTLVATLRCNHSCGYCHASAVDPSRFDLDMSLDTAKRCVDFAFTSGNPELMIEFQGGEPLLNWPVVRFVCDYARRRAEREGRIVHIGLISNFTLLDDRKLDFLIARKVSFCTSLDGPEDLHNANRAYLGGDGHAQALEGIRRVLARRAAGAAVDVPNAICTVTRRSLGRHREIVDQLAELGLERVQLGPLDPIGYAKAHWEEIGYTSAEFLGFYRDALEYILELNRRGVKIYEKMAMIFLVRILEGGHWRFPNGDALCRLAYDFDGSIYPSEEGRLLANGGDRFFRLGSVRDTTLADIFDHPTVRAGLMAASPENQPMCFQCAYSPYCTVQPVYNYQTQGGLWGSMPANGWCEKLMGIFDILFEKLRDPGSKKELEAWLQYRDR